MEREPRIMLPADSQQPLNTTVGTYRIWCRCNNCHFHGRIAVRKGVAVAVGTELGAAYKCPRCDCATLVRCNKPRRKTAAQPLPQLPIHVPPEVAEFPPVGSPQVPVDRTWLDYERYIREQQRERHPANVRWGTGNPGWHMKYTVTYANGTGLEAASQKQDVE